MIRTNTKVTTNNRFITQNVSTFFRTTQPVNLFQDETVCFAKWDDFWLYLIDQITLKPSHFARLSETILGSKIRVYFRHFLHLRCVRKAASELFSCNIWY